ncbi:MAG: hypothetical protein Tsb0014_07220 [Pleurocapsa sp.]
MSNKIFNTVVAVAAFTSIFSVGFPEIVRATDSHSETGAVITVTIEEPSIETTQLTDDFFVVDFNEENLGTHEFSLTNSGTTYSYGNNLRIDGANQWGGADDSRFITNGVGQGSFTISVDEDQKYYGFWWSAGDAYNKITFKNDGVEVAVFQTSDLVDFINSSGVDDTSAYYGNPTYTGTNTGHLNEPFAFVNVFFNDLAYDEIVIETMTDSGAAFESDNHTFSAVKQEIRGNIVKNQFVD